MTTTGGIRTSGDIRITNTTISGNTGSGLKIFAGRWLPQYVYNNTIVDNHGDTFGTSGLVFDGLYYPGSFFFGGNIIAFNSGDCYVFGHDINDRGGNFDTDGTCRGTTFVNNDVDLTLADNGGPTLTHALPTGSAAVDAAGFCTQARDQRGAVRPVGVCDSGAYERAVCGDLIVDEVDETCDPPRQPSGVSGNPCRADCTVCGDGRVDPGEACDDGNTQEDDCCSANCEEIERCGGCLDPAPNTMGGLVVDIARLIWPPVPNASTYEVVAGDLFLLATTGGDFGSATTQCLASDYSGNTIDVLSVRMSGSGLFFLVRPKSCGGAGSFDVNGVGQVASRDSRIEGAREGCPLDAAP